MSNVEVPTVYRFSIFARYWWLYIQNTESNTPPISHDTDKRMASSYRLTNFKYIYTHTYIYIRIVYIDICMMCACVYVRLLLYLIWCMLCTAQLPGPVLKAFGRVHISPFQMADKSPMITDQHRAGGSVSQLSQWAKLSPSLTLSTKGITTSFWHYKKYFVFYLTKSWVYIISLTQ